MFIFYSKLKLLKSTLNDWNKNTFRNLNSQVNQVETLLGDIQDQIQNNGSSENLRKMELKVQEDFNDALNKQEWFWKEKAIINWHIGGDKNTAYFHRMAKIRNSIKSMSYIKIGDSITIDPSELLNTWYNISRIFYTHQKMYV